MAARTKSRSSSSNRAPSPNGRSRSRSGDSSTDRSAFSWSDNAGPLLGVALAGAALGFVANYGRKFMMQGLEAAAGDWDEILATEHEMTLGHLRQDARDRQRPRRGSAACYC